MKYHIGISISVKMVSYFYARFHTKAPIGGKMKKLIIIYLSLFLIASPLYSQDSTEVKKYTFTQGEFDGELSAQHNYSGGGWLAGGLASGLFLGLIGTGIIYGISNSGEVSPPIAINMMLEDKPSDYRSGFYIGYSRKAKKQRKAKALTGGLLGTAAFLILFLNAQ